MSIRPRKYPPNTPTRGDRVKLRGRNDRRQTGVVTLMNDETLWATVEWEDGSGSRICHLFELEKLMP